MDRNHFYYLFVNSQSALELAMQLMAEKLMAEMESEAPIEPAPLTDEERQAREAQEAEYWKNFDFEAIKTENGEYDLSRFQPPAEDPAMDGQEIVLESPPLEELTEEEVAARAVSIEQYLVDAYAHEQDEELQARIDQCYQQVDLSALTAAVARLPTDLPPLTQALSVGGMSRWVRTCESHNEAFSEVVGHFRRWAMAEEEALMLTLQ